MAIQGEEAAARKFRRKIVRRISALAILVLIIVAIITTFSFFRSISGPNVRTENHQPESIFIPTGSSFNDVKKILYGKGLIINRRSFEWVAERKKYPALVKPGHYIIKEPMSNGELINMLRSGQQAPVDVVFNNIRLKEDLAGKISRQIEADSLSLLKCWNDREFLKTLNTTPEKILLIFIPNTYEFWWTHGCPRIYRKDVQRVS